MEAWRACVCGVWRRRGRHGQESCAVAVAATDSCHLLVDLCDLQEVKLLTGSRVTRQLDLRLAHHPKSEQLEKADQHGLGDDQHLKRRHPVARDGHARIRQSRNHHWDRGELTV